MSRGSCQSGPVRAGCPGPSTSAQATTVVGAKPGLPAICGISARHANSGGGQGLRLLDAGCRDGRIHRRTTETARTPEIVAVDASAGMLSARPRPKLRPSPPCVFVHSPIEAVADAGVHGPFDGILAAYLLRNLADP